MVDIKNVQKQLKKIKFGSSIWNQAELRELPHILHEHETLSQCVNGYYEGGVALLVATNMRLLLVDKKPLNYLNVEDLRFDMINEIDYSHRLVGATIIISTGSKTLRFKSYNQQRLRDLINLVQERMSLAKKEQSDKADNQQQHLEEINQQLQMYLLAQHQQLQQQIQGQPQPTPATPKPSAQLSDYLFAQRLLQQFQTENGTPAPAVPDQAQSPAVAEAAAPAVPEPAPAPPAVSAADLLDEAKQEVFHKKTAAPAPTRLPTRRPSVAALAKGLEINPLAIAYSKLPMMLRNRKFGRPSFHAHSQQPAPPVATSEPSFN